MESFERQFNQSEQIESLKESKEQRLEDIRHDVDNICDKLGHPIDEGIKETVVMFKANGLPTSESCEGHIESGLPFPWVGVSAPNEPEERFVGQTKSFEKVAKKYGITPKEAKSFKIAEAYWEALKECSQNEETEEYMEWGKENKELLEKARYFLEEFYKERSVNPDIKLEIYETGPFRIHHSGEDYRLIVEEKQDFSEEEKKSRAEKIKKYRPEMNEFTKFLKEQYFNASPKK